ncbi:hypothetical protein FCH28_04820 [Streptomyces piniterrae]|uniref:Uncharacterized protein n=1 Tax=Streptomyces piniterrae TaxID=2571125 RepID=A0A4U0NQV2_9ACTN|nr:hypothetical protein [Streptomyces piniterrae]TJZ56843.1 hypothetical protein FCH28_04820 [Streptomyces piniterrae]
MPAEARTPSKLRTPSRLRTAIQSAGTVALAIGLAVGSVAGVLIAAATPRWLAGQTPDLPTAWPGGPIGFGVSCAVILLSSGYAGWHLYSEIRPDTPHPKLRSTAAIACYALAFTTLGYVLGTVPGRHCSTDCTAQPGAGLTIATFVIATAVLGTAAHRIRRTRQERRRAAERERLRKLRKRGKGRSRAAIQQQRRG